MSPVMLTHSSWTAVGFWARRIGVLEVEDAGGGDGVGVVAAAGGIGDDLLDGGAVEAEGDVEPVAAGVLADEDLPLVPAVSGEVPT